MKSRHFRENDIYSVTSFDFILPPLLVYLRINLIRTYCSELVILTGEMLVREHELALTAS